MFEPIPVPAAVLALLVLGCAWGLVLRPRFRRRREAQAAHRFHRARLAIQPSAFQLLAPKSAADLLLVDPAVQEAVLRNAAETGREAGEALAEARRYAAETVPSLTAGLSFRLLHGPVRRMLRRWFRVRVRYADESALTEAVRLATPVFVLNHRSNLDYLIAATSLADRAILSFAVGEWAHYWPLRPMLRALGGFFVRRDSGNPLYRAVLAAHIRSACRGGVPQAFFIEGKLSEDGAMRAPRLGLLDYAVRAFDPGAARDVVFVPVACNYDRVIEDKNLQAIKASGRTVSRLTSWRAGAAFIGSQLWLFLKRRWKPYGRVMIVVGTPVSLREWVTAAGLDPRRAAREERFASVRRLAEELVERIEAVMPLLPVPLLAAVVRCAGPGGIPEADARRLARRHLERVARARGAPDIPPEEWESAVGEGIELLLLRNLVGREEGRLRVLPERRSFVDYYANSITHLLHPRHLSPEPSTAASVLGEKGLAGARRRQ